MTVLNNSAASPFHLIFVLMMVLVLCSFLIFASTLTTMQESAAYIQGPRVFFWNMEPH